MNVEISDGVQIGEWRVEPSLGRISRAGEERALEPKVMDLLVLLASRPSAVVTHEEILQALWPDVVIGDDTLARCVSKLRRAFDDDSKAPRYVETLSKRGYRLIAPVRAPPASTPPTPARRRLIFAAAAGVTLLVAGAGLWRIVAPASEPSADMIARAKDYYFQYTRADNEAAIDLYQRVLEQDPDNAEALAGLANALVQQVLRWPNPPGGEDYTRTTLGQAMAAGRLDTPLARQRLARARALVERAAALEPSHAFVQQSLGLVMAASRDFDAAQAAQERAIALNADAWGALINLGDLHDIRGRPDLALPYYERAYAAMERVYADETQRVRLWQADLGVVIGDRYVQAGDARTAETWYRRVLDIAPLHPRAVVALAALLAARGDQNGARDLCRQLTERVGPSAECERVLAGL